MAAFGIWHFIWQSVCAVVSPRWMVVHDGSPAHRCTPPCANGLTGTPLNSLAPRTKDPSPSQETTPPPLGGDPGPPFLFPPPKPGRHPPPGTFFATPPGWCSSCSPSPSWPPAPCCPGGPSPTGGFEIEDHAGPLRICILHYVIFLGHSGRSPLGFATWCPGSGIAPLLDVLNLAPAAPILPSPPHPPIKW